MTEPASFCVIVPHYEHVDALTAYLPDLLRCGLPVLVVDDGSSPPARRRLQILAAGHDQVTVIERQHNGGKGAAMITGIHTALARGFSHGIGVDADGQHDAGDIVRLMREATDHPGAIVSGLPEFGPDIPRVRLYGRMITNVLVQFETGSTGIRDAMCGFRCYPLARTAAVCDAYRVHLRMDFDPEILVRAAWRGVPIRHVATTVRYPRDGVSHFRMFRDNVLMTMMHVRLILGALVRYPVWLVQRLRGEHAGAAW